MQSSGLLHSGSFANGMNPSMGPSSAPSMARTIAQEPEYRSLLP